MSTYSQALAAHWSATSYDDLPADIVRATKRALLDTLAAGLAGVGTSETNAASAGMAMIHRPDPGGAMLWGQGVRLPAGAAALVNGTTAHAREMDDFDGCGHTGAVVVPTVCATADVTRADGKTVMAAIAAGYDIAGRMLEASGGYQPHNGRGWHSTATCGSFGAAAAAAKVLGLPAEQFTSALGIAGTYVGGVWAFMADGAMTKRLHPGKAAESGVNAAFLAKAGMTGPTQIMEAKWGGFFPTYCGESARPEALLAELGERNWILSTGIKPYACCRGAHAGIDALLYLMQAHGFDGEQIAEILIHGTDYTERLVGNRRINTVLDAQMSLPYSLAVTAFGGLADLPQFDPLRTSEPCVQRLLDNTRVVADRDPQVRESPVVEVVLKDGRRLSHQVLFAKGDPRNPVSDYELLSKARSLIVPVLGEPRFLQIVRAIDELEQVRDFRTVTALLAA